MTLNLNSTTLGELRFSPEHSNVTFPKYATVVSARETQKRDEEGVAIENSIAKIVLNCVNSKILETILKDGGQASDLASFTVEIIGSDDVLQSIDVEKLVGKSILLTKGKLSLRWVQRGTSGSWNGLKLILDNVILADTSDSKTK